MPIYEYLCPECNRVYSFMATSFAETQKRSPTCPKCGSKDLKKRMSNFAVQGAAKKSQGDDRGPDAAGGPGGDEDDRLDDPRAEREMMKLMDAAENIDENDPRQLGQLMRRMGEITGEPMDAEMEEAVRRLESGEDPEKIEEDMGDIWDDDEDEGGGMGMGGAPSYDSGLYDF